MFYFLSLKNSQNGVLQDIVCNVGFKERSINEILHTVVSLRVTQSKTLLFNLSWTFSFSKLLIMQSFSSPNQTGVPSSTNSKSIVEWENCCNTITFLQYSQIAKTVFLLVKHFLKRIQRENKSCSFKNHKIKHYFNKYTPGSLSVSPSLSLSLSLCLSISLSLAMCDIW